MIGRLFSFALVAAFAFAAAPAWAQVSSPASSATAGSSCTGAPANGSSSFFLWPDTSGHILQCNGTTWVTATEPTGAAGSSGDVQFNSSGALAGSNSLFWNNSSGYLGIGTTAPGYTLDVLSANAPAAMIRGTASNTSTHYSNTGLWIQQQTATANNMANVEFINAYGNSSAYINTIFPTQVNTGATGILTFGTANNTGAASEHMRIDNLGNVGIGITTPQTLLTLAAGSAITFASTNDYIGGNIYYSSGWKYYGNGAGSMLKFDTDGSLEYYQATSNSSGAGAAASLTEPFVINASGYVGIGTAVPANLLSVGNPTVNAGTTGSVLLSDDGNPSNSNIGMGAPIIWNAGLISGSANSYLAEIRPLSYTPTGSNSLNFYVGSWNNTASVGNPLMTIVSSGNVGIGTTSPLVNLDVETNSGSGIARGIASVQYSADATAPVIWFFKSRGTEASPSAVLSGDTLGNMTFAGYDGTTAWSGVNPSGAKIAGVATENWGSSAHGSYLTFSTTAATTTTLSERMRIDNSGNVGIGTTGPAYLLHVGSASVSGTVAEFQNSSGNCTFTPTTSTWSCSSDARLKNDIVDTGVALPWIGDMRIRDFTLKATGEHKTGVIAQEMLTNHPDMVHVGKDGFYTVDDPNPWKLVKAIQELKTDNDNLKAANYYEAAQIRALTARLDAIEATQTSKGR